MPIVSKHFRGKRSKVKGQGSKAKDRFRGLVEASYLTPFGRVAFLVGCWVWRSGNTFDLITVSK